MMKQLMTLLLAAFALALTSCDDTQQAPETPIQVGAENANSIEVSPQATRMLLLSGGTGKYSAYVADSKIASVSMSKDTLRINGILEGKTYAVIHSGDTKRRIELNIAPPAVSVSQKEVRLFPRDESKFVSVNGGGELADLEVVDPDHVINAKWNAKTNILEIEAFYEGVECGTGGLRGIMGVGSNRMNRYTVGAATQGLANYLKQAFASLPEISVAIGHDCRNNSDVFARITAEVFSANGIKVYLFESLRPTPEVSFAIRELGCQSGVMITASHNPKEYNGYKAYWSDGAQMLAPHDRNTIIEVNKITRAEDIRFEARPELIHFLGEEFDKRFIERVASLSAPQKESIARHHDLKIVYTPIHGTGVRIIPEALESTLQAVICHQNLTAQYHLIRFFYAQSDNETMTVEFMIDNQDGTAEEENQFAQLPWPRRETYYSVRRCIMLKPLDEGRA